MMYRPLWIEIDLAALRFNFNAIQKCISKNVRVIATIKQNAYGHGIIPISKTLAKCGADFFAVESIEEAIVLRQNGLNQPILILTAVLPQFAGAFIKYKLIATLVDLDFAKALNIAAKKAKIKTPCHVKVDTGMGRLGLFLPEAADFIAQLVHLKNLHLEGIFTHFPAADTDTAFTNRQITAFNRFVDFLAVTGVVFIYRHCANSAAIMNCKQSHFNMVRPGLSLYGNVSNSTTGSLKPILSLKTKIVFIKEFDAGYTVSYDRTYTVKKRSRIAVIAAGYADGYPRALSNKARVIIKDRYYSVIGRVCMDHTMIDLGNNKDIVVGDEVTLIGFSGKCVITPADVAKWANTIPYEITSCLSLRIPRIYKNSCKQEE